MDRESLIFSTAKGWSNDVRQPSGITNSAIRQSISELDAVAKKVRVQVHIPLQNPLKYAEVKHISYMSRYVGPDRHSSSTSCLD